MHLADQIFNKITTTHFSILQQAEQQKWSAKWKMNLIIDDEESAKSY